MIRVVVLGLMIWSSSAVAAVTRVGNGDDGRDLEGFEKVESGKIAESRQKAVELLNRLNIVGVKGLGNLIPEVEKSDLYMSKKDAEAIDNTDQNKFHSNLQGMVYARTFAEPHAPTRFFPAASTLDENQLISLHIHEGLHRALPESVREDEDIVSQLTLSMTSPGANFDRVNQLALKVIPDYNPSNTKYYALDEGKSFIRQVNIPEDAAIKRPSTFRYTFRKFTQRPSEQPKSKYRNLHTIESYLYPFGSDSSPTGIGVGVSFAGTEKESEMGPLSLSGRTRIWSSRSFDVSAWGDLSLNTLSDEELKNSPYGRDIISIGLSARKDTPYFYLENILGYSFASHTDQKIANEKYQHEYGPMFTAKVRTGVRYKRFNLGGFGELVLSDYYRVKTEGGEFSYNSGRFYIASIGPEASYTISNFTVSLFSRFIFSRTNKANFDSIGNLFGLGSGEGYIGTSIALNL